MSVPISGTLTPTSPEDTYPVTDPLTSIDGWRSVPDTATRNLIVSNTPLRCRTGMAVWVQANGTLWTLNTGRLGDDTDWTQIVSGDFPGRTFTWVLGINSKVVVSTDQSNWVICDRAGTFSRWDVVAKTGPVGAALILDFLLSTNGGSTFTSLWASNPGNRPRIADGQNAGSGTSFDTTAFAVGNVLRQDMIQIGSTTAGSNLSVAILGVT